MMKISTLYLAILILSSCTINGNFQGLRSYYKDTKEKNPNLFVHLDAEESLCGENEKFNNKVVIISADDLKPCLVNEYSVLYIWGAKCRGGVCKPLNASQHLADSANVELFIIAEYYDSVLMDLNYSIKNPILGIDTKYYRSNWTNKYVSSFFYDLFGKKTKAEEGGRFILVKENLFFGRYQSLEEALMNTN